MSNAIKQIFAEDKKTLVKDVTNLYKKTDREKEPQIRVSNLSKYAEKMYANDVKTLDEIKNYLNNNLKVTNATPNEQKILQSILECKVDGERIILNDNTFTNKPCLYFADTDITIKCMTNDYLYLFMICDDILKKTKVSDVLQALVRNSTIKSATIVSENFESDVETYKGLIQDYEGNFSVICSDQQVNNALAVVSTKPNMGEMLIAGNNYKFFGNKDVCVISPSDMDDVAIEENIRKIKYLQSDRGVFTDGERVIAPDNKIKYLDKTLTADNFCPAYWASEKELHCSIMFKFEVDYNVLFEYLENVSTDESIKLITNIFYWDTLATGFDFLNVYALTCKKLSWHAKEAVLRWCDEFNFIRGYIKAWRDNQLRIHKLLIDFVSCFNNNSDYARIYNVYVKAERCQRVQMRLLKDKRKDTMVALFAHLPALRFINNQLKKETSYIVYDVVEALGQYVKGTNPDTIFGKVKSVAEKIKSLSLSAGVENACFPFIVPDGGLMGNLIDFSNFSFNPVYKQIANNVKRQTRKRKEEVSKIKETANIIQATTRNLRSFVTDYLNWRQQKKTLRNLTTSEQRNFVAGFLEAAKEEDNGVKYASLIEEVLNFQKDPKKYKFKRIKFIDDELDEFMNSEANEDVVASTVTRRRQAKETPKPRAKRSRRRVSNRLRRKRKRALSEDAKEGSSDEESDHGSDSSYLRD